MCWTGAAPVRSLLLDCVRGLHADCFAAGPYLSAPAGSPAKLQLETCLGLLLTEQEVALVPLLLEGLRERGASSYGAAKSEAFGALLVVVTTLAGSDPAKWRHFAGGHLEGMCREHAFLEGLFEIAVRGQERFGPDANGGLPRLASLAAELEQGGLGSKFSALSLAQLQQGAGGRAPRPADALRLGAAPTLDPEALSALLQV